MNRGWSRALEKGVMVVAGEGGGVVSGDGVVAGGRK